MDGRYVVGMHVWALSLNNNNNNNNKTITFKLGSAEHVSQAFGKMGTAHNLN